MALKELKTGKCQDTRGMAAELLKHTGIGTRKLIDKTFTEIMRSGQIPKSWTKNTITVLHKAGDTTDAANCRPICILDITYKIMARILYNRVIAKINAAQSVDQAGFITGFSCDDHLIMCALLTEKLWMAKPNFGCVLLTSRRLSTASNFRPSGKH